MIKCFANTQLKLTMYGNRLREILIVCPRRFTLILISYIYSIFLGVEQITCKREKSNVEPRREKTSTYAYFRLNPTFTLLQEQSPGNEVLKISTNPWLRSLIFRFVAASM